jgi:hypothetical protein
MLLQATAATPAGILGNLERGYRYLLLAFKVRSPDWS